MIDLAKVKQGHDRFLRAFDRVLARTLEDAEKAGLANVRRHPGFTPRHLSGGLAAKTEGKIIRTRNGALVRLQNRKAYANAIEKGSRAHTITARQAKTLRFIGRNGPVFRRSVRHPGTKPYRFLSRSTLAAARTFAQDAAISFAALARKFGT